MSLMRNLTAAAVGLALLPTSAQALPLVDVEVETRYWWASPSGKLEYDGDRSDLADSMGFGEEGSINFYARAALPLITLDVEQTQLSYSGTTEETFQWAGQTASADKDSSLDLNITHAGAMVSPVPLPFLDVGFGLGASRIATDASVEIAGQSESTSGSFILPVGKLEVRVAPPIIPVEGILRANGLSDGTNGYTDVTGALAFSTGLLQLRGGYRQVQFKIDPGSSLGSGDLYVDTSFSGPFASVAFAF
jgi:outer membrane protein